MGNSLHVDLNNYSGTVGFPCHLRLGTSSAIDLSTCVTVKLDDGEFWEDWIVLYTVDGATCDICIKKHVDKDRSVKTMCFILRNWLHLQIEITQTNFLLISYMSLPKAQPISSKTNSTIDPWGSVVDTNVYLCGGASKGGLVVSECTKNSVDEGYYSTVTVAHYYADSCRTDIGLSMVAKIRVSNSKLDITVEGPVQHPASALLDLFGEVNSTGKWSPMMCSHCAKIQRGRMFRESDRDDSHSVLIPPHNSVRVPPRRGQVKSHPFRWQNVRLGIASGIGAFLGTGISNFIENKYNNDNSDGVPLPPSHHGSRQNTRSIANGGRFIGNGNGSVINYTNYYASFFFFMNGKEKNDNNKH